MRLCCYLRSQIGKVYQFFGVSWLVRANETTFELLSNGLKYGVNGEMVCQFLLNRDLRVKKSKMTTKKRGYLMSIIAILLSIPPQFHLISHPIPSLNLSFLPPCFLPFLPLSHFKDLMLLKIAASPPFATRAI